MGTFRAVSSSFLSFCLLLVAVNFAQFCHAANSCLASEFICTSSGSCLSGFRRCDGKVDCNDGSDENCCNQNSNTGREFVLGFLPNHRPSIASWKFVFFLTSSKTLNFTISCPGQNFLSSGYLQANTLASVEVPIGLVMSLGKGNNGIRITGTEEFVVYGLNQAPHTTDAFLALPTYIQRFEYVVASYEGSGKSTVGVVAIDNATTVTILPSLRVNDGVTTYNAGQNSTFVLDSLQTILLQGDDVTGTRVFSDKIVSVFGGHECANVPIGQKYCDHLVQQMPPVATLGSRYAASPLATRTAGDVYRVVAAYDNTDVTVNGVLEASGLSSGSFHEFKGSSSTFLSVEMTRPAMLVQYSQGSTTDGTLSDPFMIVLPPIEQYRFSYAISTPASYPVNFSSYVGIIVPSGSEGGLRLDNLPLNSSTVWNNVPGQKLVGATISVSTGSHTIHHVSPITKFGLTIYGFEDDDSYGYTGGLQLQAECSVKQKSTDINECATNGGRGPCEHICTNTFGSFQCSCKSGYLLEPDLQSCGKSFQPCSCSNNGICRKGGFCECRPGWGGFNCSEPQCHLVNFCSGRGKCVAPNKCECAKGWTAFACAVDTCPTFKSCSSCVTIPHCGWCDTHRRCMRKDDNQAPNDKSLQCPAWFPHACVTVVSGPGNSPILSRFSPSIKVLNCEAPCGLASVRNRGNSVDVIGSQEWCSRRQRACLDYDRCFVNDSPLIQCSSASRRAIIACKTFSIERCESGMPPDSLPALPPLTSSPTVRPTSDLLGPIDINGKPESVDFEFHVRCATGEKLSNWAKYGCWCGISGVFFSNRIPVDGTDNCCRTHNACYSSAPKNCRCPRASNAFNPQCNLWRAHNGFCNFLGILDSCAQYCCVCDFRAALCLKQNLPTKRNKIWSDWLSDNEIACTPKCGKVPGCPCDNECSGHGVLTGLGRDSFCLCFPGWTGKCCDQADCSCRNTNGTDCFGNGLCRASVEDADSFCECRIGWRGACCDRRIPARRFGDPHIVTADGKEFDYFGIGEFWDCRSLKNDFGAQIRFFGHNGTSFVGGVALKTGNVTTSIFTLDNAIGNDTLPKIRYNGTLLSTDWSLYPKTYQLSSAINLYVEPTRANGSVAEVVFQFSSGVVYSANVRYSPTLMRQYLDTEFGPTAAYIKETEGLCGFMDDNKENDLVGPFGETYNDTADFVESWRVVSASNWSTVWSSSHSNFHPDDVLDHSYTNSLHLPIYGVDQLPVNVRKVAEDACKSLGISGNLLESCILDVGLSGDDTVLQQQVYVSGNCPNECSNHGSCSNGTCICISSWSGLDCSKGGCVDCPSNSQCKNGFCECDFGYYGDNCSKAFCNDVNNCTSSLHGRCYLPNTCRCNPGFSGDDCSVPTVCSHTCSEKGICIEGDSCLCSFDWTGSRCQEPSCESSLLCSGNGICLTNGTCACNPGWQGSACDQYSCSDLNDCNGEGDCTGVNVCSCRIGYMGPSCNMTQFCPSVSNCSGNGICLDSSTCQCFTGYYGGSCEAFECTQGCSGRGVCEAPEVCSCILGWTGFDCSLPSCEQLHYCSGHGQCIGLNLCECNENWSGTLCNVFTCNSNNRSGNCSSHGNCSAPGLCTCEPMYCGNDCEYPVIDECQVSSPCSHNCTDTCESYTCFCPLGFTLSLDGRTCSDVDECSNSTSLRLNNCDQMCINEKGSYYCTCNDGYHLGSDKASCLDVDECVTGFHTCEQLCNNTLGSYTCSCEAGFMIKNGTFCIDIDECSQNLNDCDQICRNTVGFYSCSCGPEHLLATDGVSCESPPTPNDLLVATGLVNVTILDMNISEFVAVESSFSSVIRKAFEEFCVGARSYECQFSIAGGKLFVQYYAYEPSSNASANSLSVSLYVFLTNASFHTQIVPADVLALVVRTNALLLTEAEFNITAVTVAFLINHFQTEATTDATLTVKPIGHGGLSTSALIGIVVGVVSAAVLLIILIFFFCIRSKRRGKLSVKSDHGVTLSNPVYVSKVPRGDNTYT